MKAYVKSLSELRHLAVTIPPKTAIYTENLATQPLTECIARSQAAATWRKALRATDQQKGKLRSQQRRQLSQVYAIGQ